MGRGLALALGKAGVEAVLLSRTRGPEDTRRAALVLIATPDEAIGEVAAELARDQAVGNSHVVLHLSGWLDRRALHPLVSTGAGLGSFHPLQSVADPETAAERFRGAFAGLEGDPRAIEAGERLAQALGMHPVRLASGAKATYHAGAVFASNYAVVIAALAERLARRSGATASEAAALYLPLMQ